MPGNERFRFGRIRVAAGRRFSEAGGDADKAAVRVRVVHALGLGVRSRRGKFVRVRDDVGRVFGRNFYGVAAELAWEPVEERGGARVVEVGPDEVRMIGGGEGVWLLVNEPVEHLTGDAETRLQMFRDEPADPC